MSKTKVFISGRSGSIGLAVEAVVNRFPDRYEVVDVESDHLFENSYHRDVLGKLCKNPEIDIANEENIEQIGEALEWSSDSIIIHPAAYVGTDKCEDAVMESVKSNVQGTQNLIHIAKACGSFFIHFSTTASMDPDDYMCKTPYSKPGYIDEHSIINPWTLYGLTKYISEVCVQQSVEPHNYMIVKPVFLYGDAPLDNASMLRKMFEAMLIDDRSKKLDVLLDPKLKKPYMRIEHFQDMFELLLRDHGKLAGETFILSRDKAEPFQVFIDIIEKLVGKKIDDTVNLIPEKDYLADHMTSSEKFYEYFPEYELPDSAYDNEYGLRLQYDSVRRYLNARGYSC